MQQSHGLARLLTHAIIHHPPKTDLPCSAVSLRQLSYLLSLMMMVGVMVMMVFSACELVLELINYDEKDELLRGLVQLLMPSADEVQRAKANISQGILIRRVCLCMCECMCLSLCPSYLREIHVTWHERGKPWKYL